MFIVANRVPVAEGYQEMFEERFRNRAGQIEKQPHLNGDPDTVIAFSDETFGVNSGFYYWRVSKLARWMFLLYLIP
jgi:hypothetical protein